MRRWLVRIMVCLLLGAATTVAVAWGLALLRPLNIQMARSEVIAPAAEPHWEVDVIQYRGGLMVISRAADRWKRVRAKNDAPSWSIAATPPSLRDCESEREVCEIAYGWPMHSLFVRGSRTRGVWKEEIEFGLEVAQSAEMISGGVLPLRPILPGFIINTLFYGAIWFGLLSGVGAARRTIHRKRGRCPMCGYDLRGDLARGCSECGWNRET